MPWTTPWRPSLTAGGSGSASGSRQMLSLVFENPAGNARADIPLGHTEKEDGEEHGFGLLNMEWAARKYQGTLRREILEPPDGGQGERLYRLEILLFLAAENRA